MKKIEVKVKNLGRIQEAIFRIHPITVITGTNGTGKSFFTKSLYSILNVINKNVYHESIGKIIRQILLQLQTSVSSMSHIGEKDFLIAERIELALNQMLDKFEDASSWKIDDFLAFATSQAKIIKELQEDYVLYKDSLKPTKLKSIDSISKSIINNFEKMLSQLNSSNKYYSHFFEFHIENELKDNFQISSLNELITFGQQEVHIEVTGLFEIKLNENKKIYFEMGNDFIDEVAQISNVVFFESPAYWKIKKALESAKELNRVRPRLFGDKSNDFLTGVPKYFYDLNESLSIKNKKSGNFEDLVDSLKITLGGEFIFEGNELSFKDDESDRKISKNLMSLGMTNLGMIHALLKHNIITAGSFVFIDEPETNLHPDWQVKIVNVLLELARADVNIVITTHSTDIIKALEIGIKKLSIKSINDFLSVHFIDLDGKLYEFESEYSYNQLIEARTLLNSAYGKLYFSDL